MERLAKKLRRIFWFVAFMGMACLVGCNRGDDCPTLEQPDVKELSPSELARFPYARYEKLVFRVESGAKIDTVTLNRLELKSGILNEGNKFTIDSDCPKPFEARYQYHIAQYGSFSEDHWLVFRNQAGSENAISVRWSADSVVLGHKFLDSHFGTENDITNSDSVKLLDELAYPNTICEDMKGPGGSQNVQSACLSLHTGFVFVHDHDLRKKWYLLEAR